MENKKYELIQGSEITIWGGTKLMRIRALRDFSDVKKGDIGGYVQSEENLSHEGDCWIYGNASVCDNARVFDSARVLGDARVYGDAEVCGDAMVLDQDGYIVFKNWWSSGRYFTWTRSNNMWRVGCFYGTGDELIKKAYKDSERSGREYERIVKYVEGILRDERE